MEDNFCECAVSQPLTLQNVHSNADMLQATFQKFTKKRFLRTTLNVHYNISFPILKVSALVTEFISTCD